MEAAIHPNHFLKINVSEKKWQNLWKSGTESQLLSWAPRNFRKIKTPSQVASKNFAKILIDHPVYIFLNSGIVASKITWESATVELTLLKYRCF